MTTLTQLLDTTLPLNRKERYYTGTVLPAIVCVDNFTHLTRLTDLLGVNGLDVRADPADCTVVFFTEYGIEESLYGPTKDHFVDLPAGKDTPDVVILVTEPDPVLIAIEAKLYDKPQPAELAAQLARQYELLNVLTDQLAGKLHRPVQLVHTALLPHAYKTKIADQGTNVITWEQLLDAYEDVAQPYFLAILAEALHRYPDLVSRPSTDTRPHFTGAEILQRHRLRDPAVSWIGRRGGLNGPHLAADITTGGWRTFPYECAMAPVGNSNWFSALDFAQRVASAG